MSLEPSSSPSSHPSMAPSSNPTRSTMPSESPSNDPSQKPSLSFLRTRSSSAYVTLGFEKLTPLDDTARRDFEIIALGFLNKTKFESEHEEVSVEIRSVSIVSQNLQDQITEEGHMADSDKTNHTSSRNLAHIKEKILAVRIKVNGDVFSYRSEALDDYDFESIVTFRFKNNFSNFTQALSQSTSPQFHGLEGANGGSDIDDSDGFKMDLTFIIILAGGGGFMVIVLSVAITILCMRRR